MYVPMCFHIYALICISCYDLSYIRSPMYAFISVLSSVLSYVCAPLCVCSPLCSHICEDVSNLVVCAKVEKIRIFIFKLLFQPLEVDDLGFIHMSHGS